MRKFVLSIIMIATANLAMASEEDSSRATANVTKAKRFMETALTDSAQAKALTHDDFEFVFMGRTRISNKPYDQESYFTVWLPEVVGKLVPNGFRKLEILDAIGDSNGVALIAEGDADGINGLYDNQYVFVFKFKDGKIVSLREYNSDLLVATRLYKQKLVADD
ncbi:MAG: hypothetical protein VX252_08945 [Myxococcota bacterium]|nr:hypothetical protein [Myxococcota bacterium]